MVELAPVEDVLLPILRDAFPGVQVKTEIDFEQGFPFILLRSDATWTEYAGDPRFTDIAPVIIHTFCDGANADQDAALLAEAVRVALRDAWLDSRVVPNRGHIAGFTMTSRPRRVTDWATATGPVQYADLPTGVWRYETRYDIEVRKSPVRPFLTP